MKLATIILATAFALTGAAALAKPSGLSGPTGFGSVVQPSVGSYVWPSVGSTNAVPTWTNTGPAAQPRAPSVGSAVGSTFPPMNPGH
jgi:hypothetical protein